MVYSCYNITHFHSLLCRILVKTPSLSNKDKPSKQLSQTSIESLTIIYNNCTIVPEEISVHGLNVLSTVTGTSQSALTTVSVDDLEDSDFSDWK